MNSQVITIALIVLCGLMAVGVVTTIIMKKCKAHENAVTISILATSFCGLLAAGALVFLVTFNMMKDYMEIKRYKSFELANDDKSVVMKIVEYANDKETGFEIYLNDDGEKLADISTEGYMPFTMDEFELEWKDSAVTIYYSSKNDEEGYRAKSCTLHFDGSFDQPVDCEKDLRNPEHISNPPVVDE